MILEKEKEEMTASTSINNLHFAGSDEGLDPAPENAMQKCKSPGTIVLRNDWNKLGIIIKGTINTCSDTWVSILRIYKQSGAVKGDHMYRFTLDFGKIGVLEYGIFNIACWIACLYNLKVI